MNIKIRPVVIGDYDRIYELWNSTEQSKGGGRPVDAPAFFVDYFF